LRPRSKLIENSRAKEGVELKPGDKVKLAFLGWLKSEKGVKPEDFFKLSEEKRKRLINEWTSFIFKLSKEERERLIEKWFQEYHCTRY